MGVERKHAGSERQGTDESLRIERQKTDVELAKQRADVELDANTALGESRDRADEEMRSARARADEQLRGAGARERSVLDEQRSRHDEALRQERIDADATVSSERDARTRALAVLLRHERQHTDRDLLVERERADRSINSRDEFLAVVSHDVRNLLGGVALSAASLLKLRCEDEELRNAIARDTRRIQRHTAHMSRLVGDLLDVTSIEAGHLEVVLERRDATELLRETLEVFEPIATAKRISISTKTKSGSLRAKFDHARILQVLSNLVGNAIKFTPHGGRIEIVVEPIDHEIRFAVADTGVGIPPDVPSALFERFGKVGRSDRSGLGLGLYIARCIVEAHAGRIWVESQLGQGSTFYFTLPAA